MNLRRSKKKMRTTAIKFFVHFQQIEVSKMKKLKVFFTAGKTSVQPYEPLITLSQPTVLCRSDLYFASDYDCQTMRPVILVAIGSCKTEMHYFQLNKMFSFNWIKGRLGSRLVHNLWNPFHYQNRWKWLRAPISQLMLIKFIALDLKATLRHFFARTFSRRRFLSPTKSWKRKKKKKIFRWNVFWVKVSH